MIDERQVYERVMRGFVPPDDSLERLVRRRDRKRRNQRIAAGVVGIAVFVAAVWIVTTGGAFDRSTQTPVVPGPTETGPTETAPTVTAPTQTGLTYSPWRVTRKDIAVGDSFMEAWVEGDGETAAAMFNPEGTFDGLPAAVLPSLHDWFRGGGWTLRSTGCGTYSDAGTRIGVVDCGFTYENDLTRALEMDPVGDSVALIIDAGSIDAATTRQTDWYQMYADGEDKGLFRSPNPARPDTFGAVWEMFIYWIKSRHWDDFGRMYDSGYGYPLLDPRSIGLWERYTDEFVASPQELRRSFAEWMTIQSFDTQARRICMIADHEFWATVRSDDLRGRGDAAFFSTLADMSEETLAELRALRLETDDDRATMVEFVPLAERWIELFRQMAEEEATGDRDRLSNLVKERLHLQGAMWQLIDGCLVTGLGG